MIFEFIEDIAKLTLIVACLYFALSAYVHQGQSALPRSLRKRPRIALLVLVLAVSAAKVSEDVLGGESGPIDRTILLFIHEQASSALIDFFKVVTFTGSSRFLVPLASIVTVALLCARRRFEALLIAVSVTSGAFVVYLLKLLVGRSRPMLWDTDWYWGTSFPSGHTLVVAAFATATTLCVNRIRPRAHKPAVAIAVLWISLVAISRLILGVHWPTDVLAAACIGIFLPLALSVALEVANNGREFIAPTGGGPS